MKERVLPILAAGIGLVVGAAADPHVLGAQDVEMRGRVHGVRPPPGYYDVLARYPNAYEFQNVWKEVARQVRERRQALARAGDYATLNAHFQGGAPSRAAAQAAGVAVTGDFRIPVLIGLFSDSTHVFEPATADLDSVLFGTVTAPPYTVHTFYDEMSNGLVNVIGDVIGWFTVDSASTWYEGFNNGLSPSTDRTGNFIVELLNAADATVDFSQYDNDGDNLIDLVTVLHPLSGGECGSSHIWSHRWVLAAWGQAFSGDGVSANDYMIQPAVGGSTGCDATQIMPIGTFSHELGHGMTDLPDLYDTGSTPSTFGIGVWGLMGAGSWNTQTSPAHMSAWSKDDAGWITIDTVTASSGPGARTLNPVISSDTALRVNLVGTNEYFLLENRHRSGADANLRGEGLLIWHVDPDRIASRRNTNTVNAVMPHGLDLEQADGQDDLGNGQNAGDAGDPYPGTTNNTIFGPTSAPNSELNDNSNSGLLVDSITINPDQSIAFRIQFNTVDEVVTTNIGAGTQVTVDGSRFDAPHSEVWIFPSMHTIGVDSIQGDTLTRYAFQSWSDGGARVHSVTADATADTFTANLETQHRLRALSGIEGSITSSVPLDANGVAWLLPTDMVQLNAVPNASFLFVEWTGDTTAINTTLDLVMARPFLVRAVFGLAVAVETSQLAAGVMGASYVDTLEASGGSGSYVWSQSGGDALPAGLSLDPATGAISGVSEEDGAFAIVFQAVSGAISSEDTVPLTITRPNLLLNDVVNHLLSPVSTLTADEERFLDIIGNSNGGFDVGDFRAFLQDVGLVADAVPAALLEALEPIETRRGRSAGKEDGS